MPEDFPPLMRAATKAAAEWDFCISSRARSQPDPPP